MRPSAPDDATFTEVPRAHAADAVFDQIAAAILSGELVVGAALPPERVLAERFGVSRVIARQAVHRLADLGLVRVRQGGATTILGADAATASDVRIIELVYRLGPRTPREARELAERQLLQGYALVYIAARRAPKAALERLAAIVDDYAARGAPEADLVAFERAFWGAMATAGDNRLYAFEVAWWFRLLGREANARHHGAIVPSAMRAAFYRELLRRLLAGETAERFFIDFLLPFVARLEGDDGDAAAAPPPAAAALPSTPSPLASPPRSRSAARAKRPPTKARRR